MERPDTVVRHPNAFLEFLKPLESILSRFYFHFHRKKPKNTTNIESLHKFNEDGIRTSGTRLARPSKDIKENLVHIAKKMIHSFFPLDHCNIVLLLIILIKIIIIHETSRYSCIPAFTVVFFRMLPFMVQTRANEREKMCRQTITWGVR